jgi:hypothetical protein
MCDELAYYGLYTVNNERFINDVVKDAFNIVLIYLTTI